MQNQQTNIFVINLEKSTERKQLIIEQFKQFPELKYEFFKAVNGKENPDFYLFKKYNEKKRLHIKANTMSLSQLGCWASHYLLWEKCVELNKPLIVLEDDSILQPNFLDVYSFCMSDNNPYEFFFLSPTGNKKAKTKFINEISNSNCKIFQHFQGHGNTVGYFITPKSAKKFLSYSSEWIYNVDVTMDRWFEHQVQYLTIEPYCVKSSETLDSTISDVNKINEKRTLMMRFRREYFRFLDQLKIYFTNAKIE